MNDSGSAWQEDWTFCFCRLADPVVNNFYRACWGHPIDCNQESSQQRSRDILEHPPQSTKRTLQQCWIPATDCIAVPVELLHSSGLGSLQCGPSMAPQKKEICEQWNDWKRFHWLPFACDPHSSLVPRQVFWTKSNIGTSHYSNFDWRLMQIWRRPKTDIWKPVKTIHWGKNRKHQLFTKGWDIVDPAVNWPEDWTSFAKYTGIHWQ